MEMRQKPPGMDSLMKENNHGIAMRNGKLHLRNVTICLYAHTQLFSSISQPKIFFCRIQN